MKFQQIYRGKSKFEASASNSLVARAREIKPRFPADAPDVVRGSGENAHRECLPKPPARWYRLRARDDDERSIHEEKDKAEGKRVRMTGGVISSSHRGFVALLLDLASIDAIGWGRQPGKAGKASKAGFPVSYVQTRRQI